MATIVRAVVVIAAWGALVLASLVACIVAEHPDWAGATQTAATGAEGTDSGTTDGESSGSSTGDEGTTDSGTTSTTETGEPDTGTEADATTETATGGGECGVRLAEVLYDLTGGDDGWEWIKLYNDCEFDVSVDEYALGWGGTDYTYGKQSLSGTILAGDCLLVGGPQSGMLNENPIYDVVENFEPDVQNGGVIADGVALFDVPSFNAETVPIDVVVYGGSNDNGLIDKSGQPVMQPYVGNVISNQSIRRVDSGKSWEIAETPTPNECPQF